MIIVNDSTFIRTSDGIFRRCDVWARAHAPTRLVALAATGAVRWRPPMMMISIGALASAPRAITTFAESHAISTMPTRLAHLM